MLHTSPASNATAVEGDDDTEAVLITQTSPNHFTTAKAVLKTEAAAEANKKL